MNRDKISSSTMAVEGPTAAVTVTEKTSIAHHQPKKDFIRQNRMYVAWLASTNRTKAMIPGVVERRNRFLQTVATDSHGEGLGTTTVGVDRGDGPWDGQTALAYRSQQVQTVYPYDRDAVMLNSVVRYPKSMARRTGGRRKPGKAVAVQTDEATTDAADRPQTGQWRKRRSGWVTQMAAAIEDVTSAATEDIIIQRRPFKLHRPGELPKYLKIRIAAQKSQQLQQEQQKQQQREQQNRRRPKKKSAFGVRDGRKIRHLESGQSLLPDSERLHHLTRIRQEYADKVKQLNELSQTMESTPDIKRKRNELKTCLEQLEVGLKLFSKKNVVVSTGTGNNHLAARGH